MMCGNGKANRDDAIFWGVIGLIVLASSLVWLGRELWAWEFEFPFWPAIAIWVGVAITASAVKKLNGRITLNDSHGPNRVVKER